MSKIKFKEFIETNPALFARANSTTDFNSKLVNGSHCWNWSWGLSKGYATMRHDGKPSVNLIRIITNCPADEVVRHLCDNPKCINPDHLEPGTVAENNRDRCKNGNCKHCPDQSKAGKITWYHPTCKKYQCCQRCYHTKIKKKNRMTEEEYDQYRKELREKRSSKST